MEGEPKQEQINNTSKNEETIREMEANIQFYTEQLERLKSGSVIIEIYSKFKERLGNIDLGSGLNQHPDVKLFIAMDDQIYGMKNWLNKLKEEK